MTILHVLAPGVRVFYRGDACIEIHAPAQGFPQRPLVTHTRVLRVLEQLAKPSSDDQVQQALAGAASIEAARELLEELIRFGIVRRHHVPGSTGQASPGTRGFLIFALGDQRYGQLAYNAARSIKHSHPEATVAVCHHGAALAKLSRERLAAFDRLIECPPPRAFLGERFAPLWAKLHADLISPFDFTVVVDADTVFFPGAPLAEELVRYQGCDFAPTCTFTHVPGKTMPGDRVIVWADAEECIGRFGLSRPIHQVHLFYFAFHRTVPTQDLFRSAREVYLALGREPLKSMRTWYAGRVSAELAMSIATAKCDFALYSASHVPVMNNAMLPLEAMTTCCLGLTFCGAPPDAAWQARYDAIVRVVTPPGIEPLLWSRIAASS
ncbi:MAG: hypothetical protein IT531_03405 [Burkholderiales bacterium]|nr:hypothetical protein [Burkholderiales bacterium]